MRLARIILSDVPIRYNDRKKNRKDNPNKKSKFGIGAAGHYSGDMTAGELMELGSLIKAVSAPDAYLFYWTTTPTAFGDVKKGNFCSAARVMEAWGFSYKSLAFDWVKTNPVNGETFYGPGTYIPANSEWNLLGVKGRPWHSSKGTKPRQVVMEPHPVYPADHPMAGKKIHSRKPDAVHERIEQWLGNQIGFTAIRHGVGEEEILPVTDYEPYMLELFATKPREGWECLGMSVTGNDIRVDLENLAKGNLRNE